MHTSPQRFEVQWDIKSRSASFNEEIATLLRPGLLYLECSSFSSTFKIHLDALTMSVFLNYTQHITCTYQQGTTIPFQEQRDAETVFPMAQLPIYQVYHKSKSSSLQSGDIKFLIMPKLPTLSKITTFLLFDISHSSR